MKKIVWLLREKANNRDEYSPAINWWYGILEELGYEVVYENFPSYGYSKDNFNIEEFYNKCKSFGADIILHPAYENIHPELEKLKDFAKVYVLQSDDDWRFDFSVKWTPYITSNIGYAGKSEKYLKEGIKKDKFIPTKWGYNPITMQSNLEIKKDIILSHAGGLHADRKFLLSEFKNKGLNPKVISNCFYEEIKQLWARSKYSLCFTQNSLISGTQIKGRVSEIPYFSVLVSQGFEGIDQYYEPDKEFILFNSVDEAIDKIKFYENNPTKYKEIYNAGRKRLLSTGTAYHRWNEIMSKIDPDFVKVDVENILKEKHNIKYEL